MIKQKQKLLLTAQYLLCFFCPLVVWLPSQQTHKPPILQSLNASEATHVTVGVWLNNVEKVILLETLSFRFLPVVQF